MARPNLIRFLAGIFLTCALFFSCKKDDSSGYQPDLPDLQTRVTSSVSGFVTDENNLPVQGATVQVGTNTASTDEYGYFSFTDVQVVKNAALVTVTHSGYFKGMRTYIAEAGNPVIVRIKLLPKTNLGTIDAATGGSATAADGLKVELPANSVADGSGAAYTGPVTVSAKWLNPEAADFAEIMPGDLRALNTSGEMRTLLSYGMAAVELTGSGGQPLRIAEGKKSTVSFPLPSTLQGPAPTSIPLWHFDEEKGLWIEEGSATKSGDKYVGEVSHFSFWNCDVPANFVQFNVTVHDVNGNPVPYALVKLTMANAPFTSSIGYTNSSGYVNGAIPANASLVMTVYSGYNCLSPVHTQNIPAATGDVSLGTVSLPLASMVTVSGTITDCGMQPSPDAYLAVHIGSNWQLYPADSTGAFNFSLPVCGANMTVDIIAVDNLNATESAPITQVLNPGANALGNIQACGTAINEFISYSVNGNQHLFAAPDDSLYNEVNIPLNLLQIHGVKPNGAGTIEIWIDQNGIASGTSQQLATIVGLGVPGSATIANPPNMMNITEYGNVGEFISGNFDVTLTESTPGGPLTHTVVGNFRMRRTK